MRTFRTVLEQKIWERRQTFEEFVEAAEDFARKHGEPGTIGVRHLQRLVSGRGSAGRPLGTVRPATARLLERMLDLRIDELLAPPRAGLAVNASEKTARHQSPVRLDPPEAGVDVSAWWVPPNERQEVAKRLRALNLNEVQDRGSRHRDVPRSRLAEALAIYYKEAAADGLLYEASVDRHGLLTSVLSQPEWLVAPISLEPAADRLVLSDVEPLSVGCIEPIDEQAVDRFAEAALLGVRITNEPLYRLLEINLRGAVISGRVGLTHFGEYALSMDLLERELADALAGGNRAGRGELPLRDRYLPDLASVFDLEGRLCAGGVVALCAIARPVDTYRGEADYAVLVQERSGQVVNAAGRLAVIPKGFHKPFRDVAADARIGVTLRRKLEEELFGRADLDSAGGGSRSAAPMHPSRLSEPMRWLTAAAGRLRLECTGFGLNLVSGNYEFAGLVVIEDEEFWTRFGGEIEANWEAARLQVYSSLDGHLLAKLAADERWSNEGLFAFLQGLRRLRDIGGRRVRLSSIDLES